MVPIFWIARKAAVLARPRRRGDRVRRREFITLLGGAVAAWRARAAEAQPAKIGVLYPASHQPCLRASLRSAMDFKRLDTESRTMSNLVLRSTGGDPARIIPLAMELVERKVDVIVAVSAPAVTAARSATTTTPIVAFDLESDPIGSGLIDSLSRPGQ
jgi:ABC-type uncharacterized transport system substrate-binding protein